MLSKSVVKLTVSIKEPNPYQPWDWQYQKTHSASACVIEGNLLLTNAHVVRHHVYVQVTRHSDSRKYVAEVKYVDHDCELAVLRVLDESFFAHTQPVRFGGLPHRREGVVAYGYPVGGEDLATTSGSISRIEVRRYSHSYRRLLAIQTDAAINPGNSGGPVFVGDQCVGVVFQSMKSTDRTSYVIPTSIIEHCLHGMSDLKRVGVPDLGIYWQRLEGSSLRRWCHIENSSQGVLVSRIVDGGSSFGVLHENDVLLEVDHVPVASDGSVLLRNDERVEFIHLVSTRYVGDDLPLLVSRSGVIMECTVTLKNVVAIVPPPRYKRPTYFILGGLVIMPLTHEYLRFLKWDDVPSRFRDFFYACDLPSPRRREVVFINQVLVHDVNVGYHGAGCVIVDRINHIDICEMGDVLRAVGVPIEGQHVIEVDHHGIPGEYTEYCGTRIVLDASKVQTATAEILLQYGIQRDRSDDLTLDT